MPAQEREGVRAGARERHEREEEEEDLNSTFESNSISQMTARLAK